MLAMTVQAGDFLVSIKKNLFRARTQKRLISPICTMGKKKLEQALISTFSVRPFILKFLMT